MTTLDDAAERRILELAEKMTVNSVTSLIRQAWTEATEAAAKKCDDEAERLAALPDKQVFEDGRDIAVGVLRARAAAIRGKV